MNNYFWEEAFLILEEINNYGYEAYIVGGAVRDRILQKEVKDIDIASNIPAEKLKQVFSKVIPIGRNGQTFLVYQSEYHFEITKFKGNNIEEDLQKRDFTCNALALNKEADLIDPLNGIKDISSGLLKAAGDPYRMFQNDPVRLLRLIRFSISENFLVEDLLFKAFIVNGNLIHNAAGERIFNELDKIRTWVEDQSDWERFIFYLSKLPLSLLQNEKIQYYLLHYSGFVSQKTWWTLLLYGIDNHELFPYIPSNIKRHRKKAENALSEYPWDNIKLYDYGIEVINTAVFLKKCFGADIQDEVEKQFLSLPIQHRSDLEIGGKDLLFFPAKLRGSLLRACEQAVLRHQVENDRAQLLAFLRRGEFFEE
ncbi:hypothetical protein [Alkalicoccus daliensis]|uniref:tRNA nucleotidyltransferase (CCA-adding enzyme) n=1 Tax=Alkalicoccus daliensis TaxID=745820 RepID=A0A1H0AU34_9BACI|nr:hypothetical protein [Alkalicoccus daliensis]SDN36616.1 tRNA nucleotidyltransferase (CCA-adding enzyme) [Alkalicoccus daliensis]